MSIIDSSNLPFLIEQSKKGMAFRNTLCRNDYGHLKAVSFGGRFGVCSFNTYLSIAEGVWIPEPTLEKVTSVVSLIERQMDLDLERLKSLGYHRNTYGVYKKDLDERGSYILIARPLSLIMGCEIDKSPLKLFMLRKDISAFEEESVVRRYSFSEIKESAVMFESTSSLSLESLTSLTPELRDLVIKGETRLYKRGNRKFFDHYDHWDYDVMQSPASTIEDIGAQV